MSYDITLTLITNDFVGNQVETEVFWRNHTSNTAAMWREAGVDFHNYHGRPASEMVSVLDSAVTHITEHTFHYRNFEPGNGWGTVESTVSFLRAVLDASYKYPTAIVDVSA